MRDEQAQGSLPWKLLGVHSSSMDMRTRDKEQDDPLGLHCVWYADILMALTRPDAAASPEEAPDSKDAQEVSPPA